MARTRRVDEEAATMKVHEVTSVHASVLNPAPLVDDAFGHWFAGFVDGEGCFVAKVTRTHGLGITCEFSIILRADDRPMLEEIQRRLEMGIITDYGVMTNRQGVRSNPRARWRVAKRSDCLRLVELFRQYPLRAKKADESITWSAIVELMASLKKGNRWHGPSDKTGVVSLVERLRERRKYQERSEGAR